MGIRDNVVFINHDHPEDEDSQLEERRDMNAKSSKQNKCIEQSLNLNIQLAY